MTNQLGTIDGISLVAGNPEGVGPIAGPPTSGSRKAYQVFCTFPAYTGSTDTAQVSAVGAAIAATTKNGRTVTLIAAVPNNPGLDTNVQPVMLTGTAVQALTISGDNVTGQLSDHTGTEVTTSTAVSGVGFIAVVDET